MPVFYGKARNGQIEWENGNSLFKYLVSLEGKKIYADIDLEKYKRTLQQNAFHWFYLRLVAQSTGHHENELHEIFKRMFLPPRYVMYKGREIKLPATTTKLSKTEMGDYLDRISAETGVPIPDPKELLANQD